MRRHVPWHLVAMALAVWLVLATGGVARANVLIAGSPGVASWSSDVRSKLQGTGLISGAIDIVNLTSTTPSLATLQGYDAVLVYTDNPGFHNRTLFGDNLADYVDGGGGVVQMVFGFHTTSSMGLGGRWQSGAYSVWQYGGQAQPGGLTLGTVLAPGHPILAGVAAFNGGSSSYHNVVAGLNAGASNVALWSNSRPLIGVNPSTFAGRVAGLNFYAPSSSARGDFWVASTDGDLLMANALNWAASPAQAPAIPEPGTLALLAVGLAAMGRRRRR